MKSSGTLRYSPKLLGGKSEKWWLVLDCDEGICAYYRGLYRLHHHGTRQLMRPAWDSHITVIRNEEPSHKEFWEKYAGKTVEFQHETFLHTDGNYWWVTVICDELLNLRTELGLPRDPELPLHLSIGHEGLTC
jgi:hypothetical protein